jgi:hypothetical protein
MWPTSSPAPQRLVDGVPSEALGDLDRELYVADLLPTWDDDWLLIERERIREGLHLRWHGSWLAGC